MFVETKRNADFLATYLSQENFPTTSIHGYDVTVCTSIHGYDVTVCTSIMGMMLLYVPVFMGMMLLYVPVLWEVYIRNAAQLKFSKFV